MSAFCRFLLLFCFDSQCDKCGTERQTDQHIFKSCNAAKNPPMGRLTLPVKLMIEFLNVEYGPLQPDKTLGEDWDNQTNLDPNINI